MALFNRRNDNQSLPKEVQDYYHVENRGRAGVAWMLSFATLLLTFIIAAILFFGGRWVYRTVFNKDSNKQGSSSQIDKQSESSDSTSKNNDESAESNEESSAESNKQSSSSEQQNRADSQGATNNSNSTSTSTMRPSVTPNTGPDELINTGPGDEDL